jgi:hypothetical protein
LSVPETENCVLRTVNSSHRLILAACAAAFAQ